MMKFRFRFPPSHRSACQQISQSSVRIRYTHHDSRQRVSDLWIPTVDVQKQDGGTDATRLLIRAGYLRQAYAGIFQMLPLGLRVQEKLERLIDKHMRSVRASKVSLSSISSSALWKKSGRYKEGGEMFTFKDRKKSEWLLAPTHEEEITNLLADLVQFPQQLPIRLYQISRKYRDEKRPRGGLLRGREFLMKDLYTFDASPEEARTTYDEVRTAYRNFLDELKVKYVEARATSGDMGGNLSHEYHLPDQAGEDTVITCDTCDYARNEEFVTTKQYMHEPVKNFESLLDNSSAEASNPLRVYHEDFISTNGHNLVRVVYSQDPKLPADAVNRMVNPYAVKAAMSGILEVDTGVEHPLQVFQKSLENRLSESDASERSVYYLLDASVTSTAINTSAVSDLQAAKLDFYLVQPSPEKRSSSGSLLRPVSGDSCPQCKTGTLTVDKAIEVGHTFHLGTRYSSKLGLATRTEGMKEPLPVEMGCHGIGVSRLIAATASCLSDETGLNWPRAVAPFETLIAVAHQEGERLEAARKLYDQLSTPSRRDAVDVILDDRERNLAWKLKDADMIGYPVIVIVGRDFVEGKVEVQCRRLKVKETVAIDSVVSFVHGLLEQL